MAEKRFIEDALKSHNDYRKRHGVPPLKHNEDISKIAQSWANHIAKNNSFQHSRPDQRMYKSDQMGENIAMKWTSRNDPYEGHEPTDQWYSEIKDYSFRTHSGPKTGHFTQVVWKDSKEFGIGKAQTKDGKWLVVANYSPPGNFLGHYPENVTPPVDGKIVLPEKGSSGPSCGASAHARPTAMMASPPGGAAGGTSVSTSTRTTRETVNGRTTIKKIVTTTTTHPDGRKTVQTKETVEHA